MAPDAMLLEKMKCAAKRAGAFILRDHGNIDFKTKEAEGYEGFDKLKKSLVTEVDIASQIIILTELLDYSRYGIAAEESSPEAENLKRRFARNSRYAFVIDPLDGTANYLMAHPKIKKLLAEEYWRINQEEMPDTSDKFGVCISFAKDMLPIATVIYYPKSREILYSIQGEGTYLDNEKVHIFKPKRHLFWHPVRISQYSKIHEQRHLFQNRKFYGASSHNLKALLEGEIVWYCTESVDYIDFCPTLLAYREAGGVLCDEKAEQVAVENLVEHMDSKGRINNFLMLCPSLEYCRSLLDHVR